MNNRHIAFVAEVLAAGGSTAPAHSQHTWKPMIAGGRGGVHAMENSEVLSYFQVIEFRRYIIGEGALEHFAQHFESWPPEAFQPLGAVAGGGFLNAAITRDAGGWAIGVRTFGLDEATRLEEVLRSV